MLFIKIILSKFRSLLRGQEFAIIATAFGLMVILCFAHALWFVTFEPHHSYGDALWLSFITITTIGYGDISATTPLARIGTVVFALLGLVVFGALMSSMAALVINHFQNLSELKRKGFIMITCRNHILIVNWQSEKAIRYMIGEYRADPKTTDSDIVIISDEIKELPADMREMPGIHFVHGGVTNPKTYERAAIKEASSALVLAKNLEDSNSDMLSIGVVCLLERLHPKIDSTVECIADENAVLMEAQGADRVVMTSGVVSRLLAKATKNRGVAPAVLEMLNTTTGNSLFSTDRTDKFVGMDYHQITASLNETANILLVGIMRKGKVLLNPKQESIKNGDRLIYLSENQTNSDWDTIEAKIQGAKQKAEDGTR